MEEQKDREIEQKEVDQGIEDLDEFLSGLSPGITVVISRVEPAQFKGILEEIDITETSSPISLNYLIQQWGGHKLRLRFRKTSGRGGGRWVRHHDVPLYSYQPLLFGKPLKASEYNPHKGFLGATEPEEKPPLPPFPGTNQRDPRQDFLEMAGLMSKMQEGQLQMLSNLIKPQVQPVDQIAQLGQLLGLFGQMRQWFMPQTVQAAQPAGEQDEVIGLLGKLAEGFFANNKPTPPPPRLINGRPPMPVPNTETQPPIPPQLSGDDTGQPSQDSIIKMLSSMSPQEALTTFQNSVAAMPTEQRNETVAKLIETIDGVGGTDALLSVLEQKGIIGPEELDDDDEADSNQTAQASEGEDTGG